MVNPATPINNVFCMTLSGMGPLVVPQNVDFQTATNVEVDLSALVQNGNIDFISGAYIDNSQSSEDLTIVVAGTNQRIIIGANQQGYMPLLAPNNPKFQLSYPVSPAIILPIFFYNIPLLPMLYTRGGMAVSGDWLTDAELRASPVPVTDTSLAAPTLLDGSLVLDGTNQTLFAAGAADHYLIVQNPTGNNDVTINLAGGNSLASGIVVAAGGSLEISKGVSNAVTVSGTNTQSIRAFGG